MNFKKNITLVSPRLIAAILLFCISMAIFCLLAHEVVIEKEDWFDSMVFDFLKPYASPFQTQVFKFFTFFGSAYFLLPAYVIVIIILLYKKRKTQALDIGLLGVTSSLLLYVVKTVFARKRPENPLQTELTDFSFPSGHTLSSIIFFSAFVWLVWKPDITEKWKWVLSVFCMLLPLIVGVSRIVLRYHYASDVVAGLSLGVAYVLLFFWLSRYIREKSTKA